MKREVATARWGIFVEYVRKTGERVRKGAPLGRIPVPYDPGNYPCDHVWANPVFVGREKKRTAGCQSVLGPSHLRRGKTRFL